VGTPDANGDAIFNGAVDNASGIAGMIELALRAVRPERSVVFVSAGERPSGLGDTMP
jgi:Zn-dependent M28 family amino/carboxypeptidase